MKFQINVYGSPWSGNSADKALRFAEQLLSAGHQIQRVFFFFDGVYNGLSSQSPASDESNPLREWQALAAQDVELLLCIAASANRGLLNAEEARRYDKDKATVAEGFTLAGLGQWATGFHDADRIVTFK